MKFAFTLAAILMCHTIIIAGPLQPTQTAPAPAPYDPVDHWELGFDTSALWSAGGGASPLDYVFLSQMLTVRSPYIFKVPVAGGDLVMRHRLTLLGEAIVEGPESYFLGVAAGGSLEWWNTPRTFSLFLSAGGGVGWMDSTGYEIEGGQGQDFNLNWYVHSGARWMISEQLSASIGVYFQHISNGGADDINPGVNAVGPTLGLAWHF
jgi:hypothetical protein